MGRLLILALALVIAACSGLAGEPRVVATQPPQPTQPQTTGYPVHPPDLALGAEVYAEHCTACHGVSGRGDGPLVGSEELPEGPPDFTDPATASDYRPTEWFAIITDGRIDRLMPPWGNALSEEERWAAAMYTYTMAYQPEQLALGEQVWRAECAECHGDEGRGDGPEAANINRPVGDLTVQREVVTLSDEALYVNIREGIGESMPAFAEELSEEQLRAVTAYARTLSLATPGAMGSTVSAPASTPEVESTARATITGQVTNGTADGSVPAGLPITLVVDDGVNVATYETTTSADGGFTFEGVPTSLRHRYQAGALYQEHIFASEIASGESRAIDLPITIYEPTEDPAVIRITGMVTQLNAAQGGFQAAFVLNVGNTSDRVFTSSQQVAEGRWAALAIPLPEGAQVTGFPGSSQGRYVVMTDGQVADTAPVLPGDDHVVQMVYFLPYSDGMQVEQRVNYALDGPVRLLVGPETITVQSEQLPAIGPEVVGSGQFQSYGADLTLNAGDVIDYELRGTLPGVVQSTVPRVLSVGLFVAGVLMLLLAGVLYLRGRRASAAGKGKLIDALARQIAELDDAAGRGEINHDLYQQQRSELKARLAELMGEKKN